MSIAQGKFSGFRSEGLCPTDQGVFLGRGGPIKSWQAGTVTFTSAAVGAASLTEQAVTIAGATVNDFLLVMATGAPTAQVGNLGTGRVTAANTVQLRYVNPTAGGLTPPAATVYFFILFQVQ